VDFDYYGSSNFGSKYLNKTLDELRPEFPPGYTAERKQFYWGSEKTQRQYGLVAIMIVAVYAICAVLFNNLKIPFYIIATVPVSFIGLFLTFALFGFYFDQGGYAAFVLLVGLVVNGAIFIYYDYRNSLPTPWRFSPVLPIQKPSAKKQNLVLMRAIQLKSWPITLTIISTVAGLIPFLLEGDTEIFWFAFAAGTIGGLVFSMVALFVFLPVLVWRR
jgi:multidrug efflux pump subunit AcrB